MSADVKGKDESRSGEAADGAAARGGDASQTIQGAWYKAALLIAIAWAALVVLYWPVASAAVAVWYNSVSYNHCFLIPAISGYLLWERRAIFAAVMPRPVLWPLAGLLGLSLVALGGNALSILEIQQFALVGMMQAVVLTLVGWRAFSSIMFPVMYLLFMVPTGEFLVPRLQDFTAAFIVAGLNLANIPVYLDGVFLRIPNGNFHVAEACAGLRFLIASVAFGFLFAYLMYRGWKKRAVFVGLSLVIPIIANGFRAYGIVMIAHLTDGRVAAGVDHIVYGWGFFVAIMLGMMWVGLKFRDPEAAIPVAPTAGTAMTSPAYLAPAVGLVALLAASVGPAYIEWLEYRHPVHAVAMPAVTPPSPWRTSPLAFDAWRPSFPGADGELAQTFLGPRGLAHFYVAYYSFQRHGAKVVSAQNRLEDDKIWKRVASGTTEAEVGGRSLRVSRQILTGPQGRRVAWTIYWVDQTLTGDPMHAKLLGARGTLLSGHPQAAVIVLAADVAGTDLDTETRLRELLRGLDLAALLREAAVR